MGGGLMKKKHGQAWEEFKDRLIARRKGLGISQEEVGLRIDRNRTAVTNWEVGHNRPGVEILLEWIKALQARLLLVPLAGEYADVGVGAAGDTRIVDVELFGFGFQLSYEEAKELRDMLNDGLDHIDACALVPMDVVPGRREARVDRYATYLREDS
jgi:transcriptional regulator with XRE-family HTH domain